MRAITTAVAGIAFTGLLHAQPGAATDPPSSPACFDVEVNGQRAPASFDCLSHKLRPPQPVRPAGEGPAAPLAAESIVRRPSNQLGLFNRAATGHRMGNQFGRSAFPQRPDEGSFAAPMATPRR